MVRLLPQRAPPNQAIPINRYFNFEITVPRNHARSRNCSSYSSHTTDAVNPFDYSNKYFFVFCWTKIDYS